MSTNKLRYLAIATVVLFIVLPLQTRLNDFLENAILVAGYIGIFLTCRHLKLLPIHLGLSRAQLKNGIVPSIILGSSIAAIMIASFVIDKSLYADERYNQSLGTAILYVFTGLLVKTVILEELLFRGLLFSATEKVFSYRTSAVITSFLFGLWHVLPTLNVKSDLIPESLGVAQTPIILTAVVLATFVAGLILCYTRKKFDSLLVPVAIHWTINGTATILASLAWS